MHRNERGINMYDLVIKNGKVLDGGGSPWVRRDIAVKGDKIAGLGYFFGGGKVLDGTGLYVAPGFIDVHSHAEFQVLAAPGLENRLLQGVTTQITGNCGDSATPVVEGDNKLNFLDPFARQIYISWSNLPEYLAQVDAVKPATNIGTLTGHGRVRYCEMGFKNTKPTRKELDEMKRIIAGEMEAGAFGLSSGLGYAVGSYADTEELIECCKVVAEYNGLYVSHIRDQKAGLLDSVREAIIIGEKAGLPVQISHFKASGKPNWGSVQPALELINEARARGVDITVDQYPYNSGHGYLLGVIPQWLQEEGREEIVIKLKQDKIRARIKEEMASFDWHARLIASLPSNRQEYTGKSIGEMADEKRQHPVDFACDLLLEHGLEIMIIGFWGCEEDVEKVLTSNLQMVASDGIEAPSGMVHPRTYGTFPKILAKYVKEGILSLPEAVRKMTAFPALKFGLNGRGIIGSNYQADLVLFDLKVITDVATIENPRVVAPGIKYVIVNGKIAAQNGRPTGERKGMVLRNTSLVGGKDVYKH